jgi:hypothetical protein
MRHGRRDRLGRPRRQRLQLTIGVHAEPLNDRGGQNSLAFSEVSDIVTELAQVVRLGQRLVFRLFAITSIPLFLRLLAARSHFGKKKLRYASAARLEKTWAQIEAVAG